MLLHFRRQLTAEYGGGPPAMMAIDHAVAAHQDFIRIEGWTGNTALMVEHEFFGVDRPLPEFRDRHGRERASDTGLTVEQYINRLGQDIDPALGALRAGDARGARGPGGVQRRPEPSARTIPLNQDLDFVQRDLTGVDAVLIQGWEQRSSPAIIAASPDGSRLGAGSAARRLDPADTRNRRPKPDSYCLSIRDGMGSGCGVAGTSLFSLA